MKILIVHNRYQQAGGEDAVVYAEKQMLETAGEQVSLYEVDNDNISNPWSKIQTAFNSVYSSDSYKELYTFLTQLKPDIVHIHNTFPILSPSVYYACQAAGVPVVQTLHNFRLFCPGALLFRDQQVCEDCIGKIVPLSSVIHGCYRESRAGSAAVAAMLSVHNVLGTYRDKIDSFIALTNFARDKYVQAGFPPEKIQVKPNFLRLDPGVGQGTGGYALFVGRLSPEKGISFMLEAWKKLGQHIPLRIVGDGPLASLVKAASTNNFEIQWLGKLDKAAVLAQMKEATFLVFPSLWYETFGNVLIEAYATGLPVIASNLGSAASIVKHQQTGLHFQPGSFPELFAQVKRLISAPELIAQLRYGARREFEQHYTAEQNYQILLSIYHSTLLSAKVFSNKN